MQKIDEMVALGKESKELFARAVSMKRHANDMAIELAGSMVNTSQQIKSESEKRSWYGDVGGRVVRLNQYGLVAIL